MTRANAAPGSRKRNFSGKIFNFVFYNVTDRGFIDYDDLKTKAQTYRPQLILAGASAYSRIIDFAAIGMGVSAVVKEFAKAELKSGKVIELPLDTPVPTRTIGFALKRSLDRSNPAIKLVEMCTKMI